MIVRDIGEMKLCLKHELPKSAIILAGSIIEAILVDYFLAFPPATGQTQSEILKADLNELLTIASDRQVKLISDTTRDISTVLRKYRNLIHPGLEHRKQLTIDMNKANVSVNLVEIIIREIGEAYSQKLGYTAKQAMKKIEVDGYAPTIFEHLIDTMSSPERIKLYKDIPIHQPDSSMWKEERYLQKFHEFLKLHKLLRKSMTNEVRKNAVIKLYEQVTQNSKSEVLPLLCFYDEDLDLLEPEQRKAVVDYLIYLLEKANSSEIQTLTRENVFTTTGKYYKDSQYIDRLSFAMANASCDIDNDVDAEIWSTAFDQILSNIAIRDAEIIRKFLSSYQNDNVKIMASILEDILKEKFPF